MEVLIWLVLVLCLLSLGLNLYLVLKPPAFKIVDKSPEKPVGKMVQTPHGLFELQSSKPGVYDNSDEALWEREQEQNS